MEGGINTRQFFTDMRLSNKFLLCFGLIILLNTAGIGFMTYFQFFDILLNKSGEYASEIIEQAGMSISNDLDTARNTAFTIAYDATVQSFLKRAQTMDPQTIASRRELLKPMEDVIVNHFNYLVIRSILILNLQGGILDTVYSYYRPHWALGTDGKLEEMLQAALEAAGQPVFFNTAAGHGTLTMARLVRSIESTENLGYVLLDVDVPNLLQAMRSIDLEPGWALELMEGDGTLIASTTDERLDSYEKLSAALREPGQSASGGYFISRGGGEEDTLTCYYHIAPYQMYLAGRVRTSSLNTGMQMVARNILSVSALLILFSMFVAFWLSRSITRPVRKLSRLMAQVGKGDYSISMRAQGKDEIGILIRAFNAMVAESKKLMETISSARLLQKEAEFKALQAQINPHFLYNALETINWMAAGKGADDICRMVSALGTLLRVSVSNKKEFVTVREELAYVRDYVYIQNIRCGGHIDYGAEVPEELLGLAIPKLILQPLVENAIIHGLEQSADGGRVRVTGCRRVSAVVFEVSDNGAGMAPEQVRDLLTHTAGHSRAGHLGMGLANVHDRIRLYYGEGYGLAIQSKPGAGAVVTIVLPEEERHAQGLCH